MKEVESVIIYDGLEQNKLKVVVKLGFRQLLLTVYIKKLA